MNDIQPPQISFEKLFRYFERVDFHYASLLRIKSTTNGHTCV